MSRRQGTSAIIAIALLLNVFPVGTSAHQGIYEAKDSSGFSGAITLPKPKVSYAVYMRLESSEDVDFVAFEVDGPMKVKASLLVPQRPEFVDYYPTFAVVGPGLPSPDSEVPFALPEGYGAVVVISEPGPDREKFHEPFSATRYYRGFETFEQEVTEPGTYYIVVWHPEGEYGDYAVTYGEAESFTAREMIDTYKVVAKIWKGEWGRFRGRPR